MRETFSWIQVITIVLLVFPGCDPCGRQPKAEVEDQQTCDPVKIKTVIRKVDDKETAELKGLLEEARQKKAQRIREQELSPEALRLLATKVDEFNEKELQILVSQFKSTSTETESRLLLLAAILKRMSAGKQRAHIIDNIGKPDVSFRGRDFYFDPSGHTTKVDDPVLVESDGFWLRYRYFEVSHDGMVTTGVRNIRCIPDELWNRLRAVDGEGISK